MNPDEIIRALRENADWCDANEYEIPLCMGDNQWEAADLIESLQAQLAESPRRPGRADSPMKSKKRRSCEGCKREIKPFPCYPCWWCVQFQRILRRPFYRKYKARKGGKDG